MQCEVQVVGVPRPTLAYHRIVIGERVVPAQASVIVDRPETAVPVHLRGSRYEAEGVLDPMACEHPLVLEGRPLPAVLELHGVPEDATVECAGCPGVRDHEIMFVDRLPPMPITTPTVRVQLVIRAPRHVRLALPLLLVPGPNVVHVRLEPLPAILPRPPQR